MFALDRWHVREGVDANRAYGGRDGTGLAFELMQPNAGAPGQLNEFLSQHGEGVQHVGFWTPDLLGALQAAVAAGIGGQEPGFRGTCRSPRPPTPDLVPSQRVTAPSEADETSFAYFAKTPEV